MHMHQNGDPAKFLVKQLTKFNSIKFSSPTLKQYIYQNQLILMTDVKLTLINITSLHINNMKISLCR